MVRILLIARVNVPACVGGEDNLVYFSSSKYPHGVKGGRISTPATTIVDLALQRSSLFGCSSFHLEARITDNRKSLVLDQTELSSKTWICCNYSSTDKGCISISSKIMQNVNRVSMSAQRIPVYCQSWGQLNSAALRP